MIFGANRTIRNGRMMPNTHAMLQSGNLFLYTMHNPIAFLDPSGLNAILLTDTGSFYKRGPYTQANPFGHTALAIQRDNGDWYIMDFRAVEGDTNKATVIFTPLDMHTIRFCANGTSITYAHFSFGGQDFNINRYNHQLFIEGDFMASWDMANSLRGTNPGFNLLGQNCVWMAVRVLQESTTGDTHSRLNRMLWGYRFSFREMGFVQTDTRNTLIPNQVPGQVDRIMTDGGFNTTTTFRGSTTADRIRRQFNLWVLL